MYYDFITFSPPSLISSFMCDVRLSVSISCVGGLFFIFLCMYNVGLIIAIVFLAIVVFLLAIALVIALVLLVIAVTRPHVIPNWWNRCTRRRTVSAFVLARVME